MKRTSRNRTRPLPLATLAMLGAAILLIPGMASFSMWLDELNMLEASLAFHPLDAQSWAFRPGHPPLYFILLKAWSLLAGQSDLALRALSMFAGMIAAAFVFRIATDLNRTNRAFAGFTAALLFSSLIFVRYYVHQTHNYALLLALTMALLFFFERWWRTDPAQRRPYAIGSVISTTALLYTHYYGAYFIAALDLFALMISIPLRRESPPLPEPASMSERQSALYGSGRGGLGGEVKRGRTLLAWITLQAFSALLFLPWIPVVLSVGRGRLSGAEPELAEGIPTGHLSTLGTIFETFHIMLGGLEPLFLLLLVIGLFALWRRRDPRAWWPVALIATALIGSLAIALGVNVIYTTFLHRRVIYLLPLIAILTAYGLAFIPRPLLRWPLALIAIAVIAFTPRPEALPGDWAFRRAVNIVAADYEEGDLVVLQFRDADTFVGREMRYYAEQLLPGARIVTLGDLTLNSTDAEQHFAQDIVEPWLRTREDFWLIRSQEDALGDTSTEWFEVLDDYRIHEKAHHEIGWVVIAHYTSESRFGQDYDFSGGCDLELPVEFGDVIVLNTCDLKPSYIQDDPRIKDISITLFWRALTNIYADYVVYLHLVSSPDVPPVAQIDETPNFRTEPLPTYFWAVNATVDDFHWLPIPPDIPPGTYLVKLGLYDRVTLERLPVTLPDGSITDGVIMAHITIQ